MICYELRRSLFCFFCVIAKFFTVARVAGQVQEIAVQCQVYEATLPDFFYRKVYI